MTDQQAPERIWYSGGLCHAKHLRHGPPESDAHPQIEYVRADLLEAAEKQRYELAAEVEQLTAIKDIHQNKRHEYFERAEKAEAERDQALASVGAVIEQSVSVIEVAALALARGKWNDYAEAFLAVIPSLREINPDSTAALNEMLAEAWDEGNDDACAGWRAGEPNPYRKGGQNG